MRASEATSKSIRERQRDSNISDAITDVWLECREDDWNGDGAKAVKDETLELARRLLERLPMEFELPEISGDPDGAVELLWSRDRQRLALNIFSSGLVVFAGRVGSEPLTGRLRFVEDFPEILKTHLTKFFEVRQAVVRLPRIAVQQGAQKQA